MDELEVLWTDQAKLQLLIENYQKRVEAEINDTRLFPQERTGLRIALALFRAEMAKLGPPDTKRGT